MKRYFLLMMSVLLLVIACREDDFGGATAITPVPFQINVKYNDSSTGKPAAGATVSLTNVATGDKVEQTTDANGELKITNLLPGEYNISVVKTLTSSEFAEIFGYSIPQSEIVYNGNQEKVQVNANTSYTNIALASGKLGDLVIKQIYYAGSDIKVGALFRDQFLEIYNNSNEVIYADGLCFAQLQGNNKNTVESWTLPNGQFDWSQSPNNAIGSAANTDYVYANYIYQIPGSGTQYPIQPGESIVIAQTAINHKAPYKDNGGKDVAVGNPELTVDLSGANFEAFLGDYLGSTYRYDIQNPAVPDLNILHRTESARDMILDPAGKDSYIIFRATAEDVKAFPLIAQPNMPNGKTYARIPKSLIIDGVDTSTNNTNSVIPKKMTTEVDAQFTFVPEGTYSSYAVIRKTQTTVNGRIILKDIINSAEDFVSQKANPKVFAN